MNCAPDKAMGENICACSNVGSSTRRHSPTVTSGSGCAEGEAGAGAVALGVDVLEAVELGCPSVGLAEGVGVIVDDAPGVGPVPEQPETVIARHATRLHFRIAGGLRHGC